MHCPDCEVERETTCSACGCGSCLTCGYRFSCNPQIDFKNTSLALFNNFYRSKDQKQIDFCIDNSSNYSRIKLLCKKVRELEAEKAALLVCCDTRTYCWYCKISTDNRTTCMCEICGHDKSQPVIL